MIPTAQLPEHSGIAADTGLHDWDVSPGDARRIQQQLRSRVRLEDSADPVHHIAGVDCGFENQGRITRAVISVFRFPDLVAETTVVARRTTRLPYIPGLLSFRELPAVLDAMARLPFMPDLLLCDGQGIAHPRRLGIAAHLGVWLDIPAIGVGKSRLVGTFSEPGVNRGASSPLHHNGEQIGTVLRTRTGVRPVFVSPGHKVSHESAVKWVIQTTGRYRLPEPIRQADKIASRKQVTPEASNR